ncbi:hypothetical protein MHYP_G00245470 [Metynnis hypsauchen]
MKNFRSVPSPVIVATGTGQVGEGLQNTWGLDEEDAEEEFQGGMDAKEKKKDEVMVISDSEEEEVVILKPEARKSKSRRPKN